jgi:hypothetical protein
MIYAFAILSAPVPMIQPVGMLTDQIQYFEVEDLVVAVEPDIDVQELDQASEDRLLQAVVEHDRIICELFAHCVLLPLRFGTAFVSQVALEDYLRSQQTILKDRLQNLSGYAEYMLKGTYTPPTVLPSVPQAELKGKDYFLAKRSQYVQQQEVRSQQQQDYEDLILLLNSPESKLQIGTPQGSENFRAFILLTPIQAQTLGQSLTTWQIQHPDWQLDLSDALPPYHFANA